MIGGVHYPMDVISGQALGHAHMDVIRAQPACRQALEAMRETGSEG